VALRTSVQWCGKDPLVERLPRGDSGPRRATLCGTRSRSMGRLGPRRWPPAG